MTFLSSRIVPSTPRSFVRLPRARRRGPAASSSRPSSHHVPLERIAACSSRTGAATNAEAVSWRRPRNRRVDARGGAAAGRAPCPARPASRNGAAGSPSRSTSPRAQVPVRASSRPVVDASVASFASSPESQSASRSGTSAIRSAAASAAEPSSASSWKTVLIGIVWMPVTVYSSAAGTRANARYHPVRAPVAVVERQPEHPAAAVEQRVVDAPAVDPDAGAAGRRRAQALQRLGEEVQQVPAQAVGQAHGPVREAVDTSSSTRPSSSRPVTTRPLEAPRSIAAKRTQSTWKISSRRTSRAASPDGSSKNSAISACQRALTSVASIAACAAAKSSVSR